MKKIICIILSCMVLLCAGCSKKDGKYSQTLQDNLQTSKKDENKSEGNENENKTELVLYFADKQAMLVPETRSVELNGRSREQAVVEELVEGSENKDTIRVIPKNTGIISVNTEDGICTVDLSGEFMSVSGSGSASDTAAVYSVVNSLTELDGIEKVQFLIEGEKTELFGDFLFDEPFERNESLIAK